MQKVSDIYDSRIFFQKNNVSGKRRVCALTRVSTQHEQQTNALENQNQWIVDEISRHSDWIFDINKDLYVDFGVSGTSIKKRVGFNEMIEKAKSGVYDLIVTREVCRFMRNAKVTLTLVDELEKCGVEVYFVNDGIWSFNKDDYFKLTIMATYAEQESRKVSERVFSGQASARANGVHFGSGNILGYDIMQGKKSCYTTYVINEEQAETVRVIYNLVLQGLGVKKIKNYLEDNGYKTASGKTKWHVSTIERILRRRTYIGEYEYMQSVTVDPLTHERVNQKDKNRRIRKKGDFPAIIEPEVWYKVQSIIDSRVSYTFTSKFGSSVKKGIAVGKDIYCQKMRCGCGRRFKRDNGRVDGTATYRCYGLIDDGSKKKRIERSQILNDNCCINGIIDWKLDLFTLKVFDYLSCNIDEIKTNLLEIIDKSFVSSLKMGYSSEDKLRLNEEIKKLEEKLSRLLDALVDGIISREDYIIKKEELDNIINRKKVSLKQIEKVAIDDEERANTLKAVKQFIDDSLDFPCLDGKVLKVPEKYVEVFVNSIKACANNVFEYNIRVNPSAKIESPLVVPDDEYIPSIHPAVKELDNSGTVLIGEFEIGYVEAKAYANSLKRKIVRVHWEIPAKIRVYASV